MLYDLSMSESRVFVIQEIAGTKAGNPKINIMGASRYSSSGKFIFCTYDSKTNIYKYPFIMS